MRRALLVLMLLAAHASFAELTTNPQGGFTSTHVTTLPGSPDEIFDAMTGDILPWWDHHFSENPKSLRIEPWVGGRFIEEFDDEGNGALHATVILCNRPNMIRFDGPLGLTGKALTHVVTYEFTPQQDSTQVKVTVQLSGAIDTEWATIVDGVWKHFVIEAFQPYVLAGRHKDKPRLTR